MLDKLNRIFQEVFDNPDLVVSGETVAADVAGWDSFSHINLIMHVEEEFDISFTTKEIGGLSSVKDLMDLIEAKTS